MFPLLRRRKCGDAGHGSTLCNFSRKLRPLPIGIALLMANVSAVDASCSASSQSSFRSLILIWRNWKESVSRSVCIPHEHPHFPTWKIKSPPTRNLPHRASSISKSRARTTTRPHGSIAPALRLVVYSVCWRMHSIATSTWNNCVCISFVRFDPRFFLVWVLLVSRWSDTTILLALRCSHSFFLWMPVSTQRIWVLDPDSVFFHPFKQRTFFLLWRR